MEVSARTFRARPHVDRAPNGSRAFSSRSELAPRFVWGRLVPAELPHPGHAFISLHVRRIVRLVSRQAVAASRRIPPLLPLAHGAAPVERLQCARVYASAHIGGPSICVFRGFRHAGLRHWHLGLSAARNNDRGCSRMQRPPFEPCPVHNQPLGRIHFSKVALDAHHTLPCGGSPRNHSERLPDLYRRRALRPHRPADDRFVHPPHRRLDVFPRFPSTFIPHTVSSCAVGAPENKRKGQFKQVITCHNESVSR